MIMLLYALPLLYLPAFIIAEDCPLVNVRILYEELGCKPIFENNALCPTQYDCPPQKNDKVCHYRGQEYKIGENVREDLTQPGCSAACKCINPSILSQPIFTCASIECPEMFGPRQLNSSCHYKYTIDSCCSHGISCDETPKCTYEGKSYTIEERFYPDNEPCKRCVCEETGPKCTYIRCDFELRYSENLRKGCMPVYHSNNACCAVEWKCPDRKYKIVPGLGKNPQSTQGKCKFGTLEISAGDGIAGDQHDNAQCTCLVPPLLTCTYKQS